MRQATSTPERNVSTDTAPMAEVVPEESANTPATTAPAA